MEDVGNFCVCVENWRTEGKRIKYWGCNWIGLQETQYVFSGLLEIGFFGKFWKGNFLGKEFHSKNVVFGHGVGEITLPAAVVFKGGTYIPTNLSVLAK